MYHVIIEGVVVFKTLEHARARKRFNFYRKLWPWMEILMDFDGIICD